MKKFILFGFAFLSAIGAQAKVAEVYNSIQHNGVTYGLSTQKVTPGTPSVTEKLTMDKIDQAALNSGTITVYLYSTLNKTTTTLYNGVATSIDTNPYSVIIDDFTEVITHASTQSDPEIKTLSYDNVNDSAEYRVTMLRAKAGKMGIYRWDEIQAMGDTIVRFNYFADEGFGMGMTHESTWDGFVKRFPDYQKVYYAVQNSLTGTRASFALPWIKKSTQLTSNLKDSIICNVVRIDENCKLGSNAATVTLGQRIQSIPNNSFFAAATNLAAVIVAPGNNYLTFENGILYGNFYSTNANADPTKYQKDIITGTINTVSQTIPDSVRTIYTDAFKNVPDGVVITSMNYRLQINGNDTYVTFLVPSAQATVEGSMEGGYVVTGNITQAHIDHLQLQGTFMDFRKANILSNIYFNNASYSGNTLLYFQKPANDVRGYKNVIVDGICDTCIINDNGGDRFFCPAEFTARNLTYTREFDCKWKTATLPFSVSEEDLGGNFVLGRLNGFDFDSYTFDFLYTTSITAYYPYIIKTKFDDETQIILQDLENIIVKPTVPRTLNAGGASFIPVYEKKVLSSKDSIDYNYYGIQSFYKPGKEEISNHLVLCEGASIRPFRAYLEAVKPLDYYSAKFRLVDAMGELLEETEMGPGTSAIEEVKNVENTNTIYNINGQIMKNAQRGLNIIDGKVVINK